MAVRCKEDISPHNNDNNKFRWRLKQGLGI